MTWPLDELQKESFAKRSCGAVGSPEEMARIFLICAVMLASVPWQVSAAPQPSREKPYDVIAKMFRPLLGVLLIEGNGPNRAATLTLELSDVSGRLPTAMEGATLKAAIEFPDKVRLEAPVMGKQVVVCRDGDRVWATPGPEIDFLVSRFRVVPKSNLRLDTPIFLPFSSKQAIFLPTLFAVKRSDVAEVDELNGEMCRVITAGLMPELARATDAVDFEASVWVAPGYIPRRVEVVRRDFQLTVDIKDLRYSPSLPAGTWEPPADVDVYRTDPSMLEGLLYAVMNSLKGGGEDKSPGGRFETSSSSIPVPRG